MANMEEDPGASTQQFRAYVDGGRSPAEGTGKRSVVPIVIAVVAVVVVIAAIAFFVLR